MMDRRGLGVDVFKSQIYKNQAVTRAHRYEVITILIVIVFSGLQSDFHDEEFIKYNRNE